jgi:hypothetical protein
MSFASAPILGRPIDSVDSAKAVAAKLGKALDKVGVAVPHNQLLEVIARLCGAHHFKELTQTLVTAAPARSKSLMPAAETTASATLACGVRLPRLSELLAIASIVTRVEFQRSARGKPFAHLSYGPQTIVSGLLQAARVWARHEPLSAHDQKFITGPRAAELVFPRINARGAPLHLTTRMLANANYTGAGVWGLPSDRDMSMTFMRLLNGEELVSPDQFRIPVTVAELGAELRQAALFGAPAALNTADFECYTVNVESEVVQRLLNLSLNPRDILELFQPRCPTIIDRPPSIYPKPLPLGTVANTHTLRAVLLHFGKNGDLFLAKLQSRHDNPLEDLRWKGYHFAAAARSLKLKNAVNNHYDPRLYNGTADLAKIWSEIRAWATQLDSAPPMKKRAKAGGATSREMPRDPGAQFNVADPALGYTVKEQLAAYLALRCKQDGTDASFLDQHWFHPHLRQGVREFFGIKVSAARLLSDEREPIPGFLSRFMANLATQVPVGLKLVQPRIEVSASPNPRKVRTIH